MCFVILIIMCLSYVIIDAFWCTAVAAASELCILGLLFSFLVSKYIQTADPIADLLKWIPVSTMRHWTTARKHRRPMNSWLRWKAVTDYQTTDQCCFDSCFSSMRILNEISTWYQHLLHTAENVIGWNIPFFFRIHTHPNVFWSLFEGLKKWLSQALKRRADGDDYIYYEIPCRLIGRIKLDN